MQPVGIPFHRSASVCYAFVAVLALRVSIVSAHEYEFAAMLSGAAEVTPNDSAGIGSVHVHLDLDAITLQVHVEFDGLEGGVTAAHIDGVTAVPMEGNAGIALGDPLLDGFPLNGTSGEYEATFDLALASSYSPDFIAASGGTIGGALNALIFGLTDGRVFLRIETAAYPDGEIRGFLVLTRGPLDGDVNCDDVVDNFDIDAFVTALTAPAEYEIRYPDCPILNADINHDEIVNNFDIDGFVECIALGGCN